MLAVLSYSSVYMLLCWVTLIPLLISYSRATDISSKAPHKAVPRQLHLPLVVATVGLGLCTQTRTEQLVRGANVVNNRFVSESIHLCMLLYDSFLDPSCAGCQYLGVLCVFPSTRA